MKHHPTIIRSPRFEYKSTRLQWSEDIRAAKELFYSKEVIEMLENEPDANKRQSILREARQKCVEVST